jgi:uncharacterized membrane protein YadS
MVSVAARAESLARARAGMRGVLGLGSLVSLAAAAWWSHRIVPWLPLPLAAIVLGMLAGRWNAAARMPSKLTPATDVPLFVGMVLLGAQCDRAALAGVGVTGLVLLLLHWQVAVLLVRRALALVGEEPRTASLVAVGLTGCGFSAVVAARESDPETSERAQMLALFSALLAGLLGFLALPPLAAALGFDATALARWAGLALPTTAEAVLVAAAHSPAALQATGALRFVVNLLQFLPVLAHARRFGPPHEHAVERSLTRNLRATLARIPPFVFGLTLLAALSAHGLFTTTERAALARLTSWCFLTALAGVGFAMDPRRLFTLGWRPLAAALAAWALAATVLATCVAWLETSDSTGGERGVFQKESGNGCVGGAQEPSLDGHDPLRTSGQAGSPGSERDPHDHQRRGAPARVRDAVHRPRGIRPGDGRRRVLPPSARVLAARARALRDPLRVEADGRSGRRVRGEPDARDRADLPDRVRQHRGLLRGAGEPPGVLRRAQRKVLRGSARRALRSAACDVSASRAQRITTRVPSSARK